MSTIEEDVIIAPWTGPNSCKNILSVVVLSSNQDIITRISEALTKVHTNSKSTWKLVILRSLSLEEIVMRSEVTGPIAIDFVVLGLDTSKTVCLDWAKKVLGQINPDLRARRAVLVNASGLPINGMAISANKLMSLHSEEKLDLLTANVFKPENAEFLAQKLLKYMEVSVGVKTGIPNLNV